MSRWPAESRAAIEAARHRLRGGGAALRRTWLRARGRLPRCTLYLHSQGLVAWRPGAEATAHEGFEDWCAYNADTDARLLVSAGLTHSLLVDPALNLGQPDALRRYARQQFAHYHGPQSQAWPLAVWSDGRHGGACAAHGVSLDAVQAAAHSHGVRLSAMAPAWRAGLDSLTRRWPALAAPGRHAVLLVEGRAATWLVAHDGAIAALQQRFLDAPRMAAVLRLQAALIEEGLPLDEPPALVAWDIEDAASAPAAKPLSWIGQDAMAHWLLDTLGEAS